MYIVDKEPLPKGGLNLPDALNLHIHDPTIHEIHMSTPCLCNQHISQ